MTEDLSKKLGDAVIALKKSEESLKDNAERAATLLRQLEAYTDALKQDVSNVPDPSSDSSITFVAARGTDNLPLPSKEKVKKVIECLVEDSQRVRASRKEKERLLRSLG